MRCLPVNIIVRRAYLFCDGTGNPQSQVIKITAGPAWIDSDLYDIQAKPEGTPGTGTMWGPMVQALLEERFSVKVHRRRKRVRSMP